MEFELSIEEVHTDFEAENQGEEVYRGTPLYLVKFAPVVMSVEEFSKIIVATKDHSIKVKTEE